MVAAAAAARQDGALIIAPVGVLGRKTFPISTAALTGDDATYTKLEAKLNAITDRRNGMLEMREDAAFNGQSIDENAAKRLIAEAEALIISVPQVSDVVRPSARSGGWAALRHEGN